MGVPLVIGAAALTSTPATASEEAQHAEGITIDGHYFGPEDGLEQHTFSAPLLSTRPARPAASPQYDLTPEPLIVNWGTSRVECKEILQLQYRLSAIAGGNIYGGKRIIQVQIWCARDGEKIGLTTSNALCNTGQWRRGPLVSKTVWDTLNPTAPQTTVHYTYYQINPNVMY